MPADSKPVGGGDPDLYSDNLGENAPPKPEHAEDEGRDSQEAILPRTICPDMDLKVGDTLSLEVTAIHDKEISVKYSPEEHEDEGDKGEAAGDGKAAVPAGMGGGEDSLYD